MYKLLPILLFAVGFAVTTDEIYDDSWAVIIGINEYEHVAKLNYAVDDAEIIHEMLVTLFDFPEENITILKNEEANKQSILKVFSEITTKAEKNDRVLIYFAGHGDTFPLPNDEGDMGYLLPVDCNYDNFNLSSISMQSVYDIIDESVAKHILLLIDAATSGFPSNREYEGVIDPSTSDYIQKIKEAKVRQIITAGSKDEQVIERAEWGHSAFTMNLIRGLRDNLADSNKDGFVTGYELGLFLKNTTLDRTDNYQMSKSIRMSSDKGEFVFINNNYGKKDENLYSINRDDIYDDSWAVIIGIDKYKYSKQLNYAVKDAEAVKDILINKFDYPEENIRYLTDEEATLSNIKLSLGEVATTAGENDRILVFYSGHGETLKGADGSETGYIIPYEGRQDNPYATGLVMDEILRTCQISKSKHMLFLMDACYSGLMTENVKGLSKPQEKGYLSKVANEKARQIITAGNSDEQVIERDEWQHSAFTKNLIEGLDTWGADYNDDGCITADELSSYLREHVTEDSDFQQTPQDGRFRNSGGGEFVFFGEGNKSSNQDGSPSTINNISISKIIESTHMHHDFISYNVSIVHVYKSFLSNEELMRYSCMDAGWTHYSNDKMGFRIAYNYCLDKNSNSSFINPRDVQLRTNGITMEFNYRVHRGTKFTLSPSNRLPEQYGEYKFLYFSLGFTLAKANYYSITSDFSRKGIGIIPEFGFGISLLGSRSPLFMLKLGYPFFNMLDENNSKVLNGIIMNLEFGIDLITW